MKKITTYLCLLLCLLFQPVSAGGRASKLIVPIANGVLTAATGGTFGAVLAVTAASGVAVATGQRINVPVVANVTNGGIEHVSATQQRADDIRFAEYVTRRGIRPENATEELHLTYLQDDAYVSIAELTAYNIPTEHVNAANYYDAFNQRVTALRETGHDLPVPNIQPGIRGARAMAVIRDVRGFIAQADSILAQYSRNAALNAPYILAAITGPGRSVAAGEYSPVARLVFGATRSIIERDDARQIAREIAAREAVDNYRLSVAAFFDDSRIMWYDFMLSQSQVREVMARGAAAFDGRLRRQDIVRECTERALSRLSRGEGFAEYLEETDSGDGISISNPVSREEFNSDSLRYQRLMQAELRREGIAAAEFHDLVPILGPAINFLSGDPNALTHLGIDLALLGGPSVLRAGANALATVSRNALRGGDALGEVAIAESRLIADLGRPANLAPANDLVGPMLPNSSRIAVGELSIEATSSEASSHLFTRRPGQTVGPGRTEPFLRCGENPAERPGWRQSEIDDTIRYRMAGQIVETQVSFLNGVRCPHGTPGSIRIDNLVDGCVAVEMKNYNLATNASGLINDVVAQATKHQQHLPAGVRQMFKIDARGQAINEEVMSTIRRKITVNSRGTLSFTDIQFVQEQI